MGDSESQSNEECVPADCWTTPEAPRPERGEGIPVPTRKQKRNRAKVGSDGNVNAIYLLRSGAPAQQERC